MDLVSVQPMTAPTGHLMYMDFKYGRTERRKIKIEKILKKINERASDK